jgi:hypothetical protein
VAACPGGVTVSPAVRVTPLWVADTVTDVEAATDDVVMANVALVAPAATVTLAGTVAAAVLLLVSDTAAPPEGAPLDSATVPVEFEPPVTLVGLTLTLCRLAGGGTGVAVSVAVRLVPL